MQISKIVIKNEQEALQYCESTRNLKNKMELAGLELGKRLWIIKENGFADTMQYGSFSLFLEDIKLPHETAKILMRVFHTFCVKYDINIKEVADAGGYSLLHTVLPIVKSKEEAHEALDMVKNLSRKDLKLEVNRKRGLAEKEECLHQDVKTFRCCTECSFKVEV